MARFNSRKTTIRFEDSAGVGLTVGPGPGDFSHGATNRENTEKVRVLDRGTFDGHIEGEDLEQEWSITTQLRNEAQTDATAARLQDFLRRAGSFSALQTVSSNPDIWAFRVVVTMITGGVTATRTLPHCLADHTFAEALEGNTLSIAGTNNGPIAVT
ncbi:MAG: hypothetical protein AAF602_33115 [Myxococcota bacterium]